MCVCVCAILATVLAILQLPLPWGRASSTLATSLHYYQYFHLPSLVLFPLHGIMLGTPPSDGNRRAASTEYKVRSSDFKDEVLWNPSEDGEPKVRWRVNLAKPEGDTCKETWWDRRKLEPTKVDRRTVRAGPVGESSNHRRPVLTGIPKGESKYRGCWAVKWVPRGNFLIPLEYSKNIVVEV